MLWGYDERRIPMLCCAGGLRLLFLLYSDIVLQYSLVMIGMGDSNKFRIPLIRTSLNMFGLELAI